MNKPHITTLGCFDEVAKVIGNVRAQRELWKVVHWGYFKQLLLKRGLLYTFYWNDTPQGYKFWHQINQGINPYV